MKTAALAKGATAVGAILDIDQLRSNYIIVLSINGINHFEVVQNITDTTAYLFDPDLGNIEMTMDKFNELYTGYALVISNGTIQINGTLLTDYEMQNIKALAYKVRKTVTKVWVPGYYYKAGKRWVDTSYSIPIPYLVFVRGYWIHWGPFYWYVFPHPELRVKWVKINRGYWKTIWKYKPGYWTKRTTFEVVKKYNWENEKHILAGASKVGFYLWASVAVTAYTGPGGLSVIVGGVNPLFLGGIQEVQDYWNNPAWVYETE
ncbi:hypothetical protein A9507_01875 [Methanobacterium sp. A39]|uniref:Peptidase C39 domain-containing protein n=1 Tax=Methanobacterium bryantii TaxID=2161 RepID=A0A2A2H696_METBR|nr:hypothetical protein A9507_01875 [Methanobacterium sp. A39]PAV04834.1 hypothetical protein ASJ80_11020 [Methanobacterium bryantii]